MINNFSNVQDIAILTADVKESGLDCPSKGNESMKLDTFEYAAVFI